MAYFISSFARCTLLVFLVVAQCTILFIYLFIYLLTEHLHLQRNITAGQQGTNK